MRFLLVSGITRHDNMTKKFGVLNFVIAPQPELKLGFTTNFQDVFTPTGSRVDKLFGGYQATQILNKCLPVVKRNPHIMNE